MMITKTYSELITLRTFEERFEYLVLNGKVGHRTFGDNRYLNQQFYRSPEWRRVRQEVIIRDNACDLAIPGLDIFDRVYVHHMNPVTIFDLQNNYNLLLDPEYLISTSFNTHQAITFGDPNNLLYLSWARKRGDTTLW